MMLRQMGTGMLMVLRMVLCIAPGQYGRTVLTQVEAELPPDAFLPCPWILQIVS